MQSVLDFVGAFFNLLGTSLGRLVAAIGASIGRLVAAIALGILCAFGFGYMVFRLNLWATPSLWVGAFLGFFGLWLGAILFKTGRPAKIVMSTCIVTLIGITAARWFPNATAGGRIALANADKQALARAERMVQEVPSKIRCDAGNMMTLVFFTTDGNTGERKNSFWYARSAEGRIECYDRAGFDPVFGKPLDVVSQSIVQQIALQPPPEGPKPVPTPEPVQMAEVSPVPTTIPAAVVAPVVQPTPESTREYATRPNLTVTVSLTEPLDVGRHGENHQFEGLLTDDITDPDGVVLANAGTRVEMIVSSLQMDPRTNAALVEMSATSLTTTGGTAFPVSAHSDELAIRPPPRRTQFTQPESRIFGARIPQIREIRVTNRERYILPPKQIRLTIAGQWIVPAAMLARAR